MKFTLLCLILISTTAYGQKSPFPGMQNVTDWAHLIDDKDDVRQFDSKMYYKNDWFEALERQPVLWGTPKELSYNDIENINNKANNSLKGQLDEVTYGIPDYTATPSESLSKGSGDCEDYSVLKYYWLAALGAKPERMNIYSGYYIKGMKIPVAHNVLVVEDNLGKEWVLDIMNDKPIEASKYMNVEFMPKHRIDNRRVSIW